MWTLIARGKAWLSPKQCLDLLPQPGQMQLPCDRAQDNAAAAHPGKEAELLSCQGAEQAYPDQFKGVDQGGLGATDNLLYSIHDGQRKCGCSHSHEQS